MTITTGNFYTAWCYSGHLAILPHFDVPGVIAVILPSTPFTDILACFQAYKNSYQDILNIHLCISSKKVDILGNDHYNTSRSKYSELFSPWCYSGPFAKPNFQVPGFKEPQLSGVIANPCIIKYN